MSNQKPFLTLSAVIPAKAGIHLVTRAKKRGSRLAAVDPGLRRDDGSI
jgi:hypothetical protein